MKLDFAQADDRIVGRRAVRRAEAEIELGMVPMRRCERMRDPSRMHKKTARRRVVR